MSSMPTVLVVNDDTQQREAIRNAIEGICEVIAPESYERLLEALECSPTGYAAVILDYIFEFWNPPAPPRNGADVLAILRPNKESAPPVLLLSNYVDEKAVEKLARDYHIPAAKFSETTPLELYAAVVTLLRRSGWDV